MDGPAANAGKRRTSKRKSLVDTIEVQRKFVAVNISDNSDDGLSAQQKPATRGSRTRGGKGKAPVELRDEVDSDDAVEEYQFNTDDELDMEEDEDLDDARSIITLSSESSTDSEDGLSERPWKSFSAHMREQWELMYANVTMHPISDDWDITEDYQREKDAEMLRYLSDYPLKDWILPQEQAMWAYNRLLDRSRYRRLEIRIYGRERIPQWAPMQQLLPVVRGQYPRQPTPSAGPPPPPSRRPGPQPSPQPGPPPMQHQGPPPGQPPFLYPAQHSFQQPGQRPVQHQGHHPIPHQGQYPIPHQGQYPMPHQGQHVQQLPPQHPMALQHHQGPPHPQHQMLPSQPYAQPMLPVHPGMGRPMGVPQPMPYGMYAQPPHMMPPNAYRPPEQPKSRRGRDKKESPINTTPPPPPPTPPYELRTKPAEKKANSNKSGRRTTRRQAEAEEFPWTRKLDFKREKFSADWDQSLYDAETLATMEATRKRNVKIIEQIDAKVQEQQRIARAAKKNHGKNPESSDAEGKTERKKGGGPRKGESGGDPYHSGNFAFASAEDEEKAAKLGFKTPDEALEAGEAGMLEPDVQGTLKICWNPGKKGMTENLEQVRFSVKDTLTTRKQLENRPILSRAAAGCIIDFCPDMLWRGMLLRITSEAGFGNKDVRDRFCYNGCYCDKATITKRISAALGQKQVQPKSKGYGAGEYEWYDENVKDFSKYIDFFGMRTSHRNMLKIQMQGEKRKVLVHRDRITGPVASSDDQEGSRKRAKTGPAPTADDGDEAGDGDGDAAEENEGEGEDEEDGHESGAESDDSNAVSVQDSDILDSLDD